MHRLQWGTWLFLTLAYRPVPFRPLPPPWATLTLTLIDVDVDTGARCPAP